jgi:hypothetical protein
LAAVFVTNKWFRKVLSSTLFVVLPIFSFILNNVERRANIERQKKIEIYSQKGFANTLGKISKYIKQYG